MFLTIWSRSINGPPGITSCAEGYVSDPVPKRRDLGKKLTLVTPSESHYSLSQKSVDFLEKSCPCRFVLAENVIAAFKQDQTGVGYRCR